MNVVAYFIIGLATVNVLHGYVLLQVRKGDNQSNVDALIHKVVPAEKFEEIADTARKHYKNYKQYKVKIQANDKDLEGIVFAIKTNESELVHFKSGEPSMMYQIEPNSVLKSLSDALKSQEARRYSDKIAKTAAYVYRLITED
nr:uncharacterized protein LOC117995139 [Maniola hyperantus]